jgi:outer membrane protein, heavy metal efflux system
MKNLAVIFLLLTSFLGANAQLPIDSVLARVERNNPTLAAYRYSRDAAVIQHKTGLFPANPEIGFNYLQSNPQSLGNRTDMSIVQSFDFPSVYVHKGRISAHRIEQADIEYLHQKNAILHEAYITCLELIHYNTLRREYRERAQLAQRIANSYEAMLDQGEVSVIEYHKANANALNISLALSTIETERNSLLAKLAALNGGQTTEFTDTIFPLVQLAEHFDTWYSSAESRNPLLAYQEREVAIAENEIRLSKAQVLPTFQAGYMSEAIVGQTFRGVTLGVTIPLWESSHTVNHAKANAHAIQSTAEASKQQYRLHMQALHAKAISLQEALTSFETQIDGFNSHALLAKSFEAGEISLTQYLLELQFYYDSRDRLFELRQQLHTVIAELNRDIR